MTVEFGSSGDDGRSNAAEARLADVVKVLERLYPLRFAEEWDHPGLIVGELDDAVNTIAFAVDPTMAVVSDAIEAGADLLVCHHPLFFRSVHEVSGRGVHGHIVAELYRAHCALWVGHTNADVAYRGVGQAAGDALGLLDQTPLVPKGEYEGHAIGLGRVGCLPQPLSLERFAHVVRDVLPATAYGVQLAGDLGAEIRRVAVLPGSGDSNFGDAVASGADVYVTSDLRHHPATDALEQARWQANLCDSLGAGSSVIRPALINTPHSAIESLWLPYAMEDVARGVESSSGSSVKTIHIRRASDPWQLVLPGKLSGEM